MRRGLKISTDSFEVEDNFVLVATFANGVIATMDGSFAGPAGRVDDLVMEIGGSRGSVKIAIKRKASI